MAKTKKMPPIPEAGSMLNQKTNEDFNKKMPNPSDPNEKKGTPVDVIPPVIDPKITPPQGSKSVDLDEMPSKSE